MSRSSYRFNTAGILVPVYDDEAREEAQREVPTFPDHRFFLGEHIELVSMNEDDNGYALGDRGTVIQLLEDDRLVARFREGVTLVCGPQMVKEVVQ